ncbi:hypothetical protein PG988_001662 [Apiospora saccharicola]
MATPERRFLGDPDKAEHREWSEKRKIHRSPAGELGNHHFDMNGLPHTSSITTASTSRPLHLPVL